MRKPRVKMDGPAIYHCMNRVVEGRFVLDQEERRRLLEVIRRASVLCGVRVLTFAVMGNHFHLLVEVPSRQRVTTREVLRRVAVWHGARAERTLRRRWERLRTQGREREIEAECERWRSRMGDISEFMKRLQQRYAQSFNRRHGREGPLWQGRFRSVLVEPMGAPLQVVADYIELNPIRAGWVKEVGTYEWSALGHALTRGSAWARRGVARLMRHLGYEGNGGQLLETYRMHLVAVAGGPALAPRVAGHAAEIGEIRTLVDRRNPLLTRGGAFGTLAFVERLRAQACPARQPLLQRGLTCTCSAYVTFYAVRWEAWPNGVVG